MTDTRPKTVGDLIAALSGYDPATPLRIAAQPGYPMEHLLSRVVCTPDDAESWGIVAFDPAVPGVFVTVGGGVRWEPLDPRNPHEPAEDIGPPDIQAWLRAPADPPSVPLPLMRDPGTGLPAAAGRSLTNPHDTRHDTQGEGR